MPQPTPSVKVNAALFAAPYERLNLWFALALLAIGIAFVGSGFRAEAYNAELLLLANFFLLNTTHVAFTFAMLVSLPEARAWFREISRARRLFFVGGALLTYAVTCVAVLATYRLFDSPILFIVFSQVLFSFARLWHTVGQVRGLSLLYNRSSGNAHKIVRLEKLERFFFTVFTGAILAKAVLSSGLPAYGYKDQGAVLGTTLSLTVLAALLGIIGTVLLQWKHVGTNKLLYSLRLFLFPLGSVNPVVFHFAGMFHGVEYLCVCRKMTSESGRSGKLLRRYLGALLIVGVAMIPLLNYYFRIGDNASSERFVTALAYYHAFSLPITFVHYFVDAVIYRMSHETTRKHFGRLLMAPAGPSRA